jgi:uncharacterized membrane protein
MAKNDGKSETVSGVPKEGAPENLAALDRLAVWITERVGTMVFFLIIFTWTVCWLFWNMLAPKSLRFDPYPGFVLWLFISNMIQLFLMPLLMIGQNLLGRDGEEQEIQTIREQLATIVSRLDEMKAPNGAKSC